MKPTLTEQQIAMWVGAGTVTLLVPCIIANMANSQVRPARLVTPPPIVAEAGRPVPSDSQAKGTTESHAQYVAEIQSSKTAITVLDGTPTASGIVATEYILRTGTGSYVSTLPVFLVGARAGSGAENPPDAPPEGRTVLWAGDAYLAGTSRQLGPDGTVQTIYQYAPSAEQALALLSAARDKDDATPSEAAATVAQQ